MWVLGFYGKSVGVGVCVGVGVFEVMRETKKEA